MLQRNVGGTITNYLYGMERLAAATGATPTAWYLTDALGSVRRTLTNTGTPQTPLNYDPWGTPEGGATPPTFGFTGELQDAAAGLVYLRARWYSTTRGSFGVRDPFAGDPELPYSLHPYQYGYANPVLLTDPSGKCAKGDSDNLIECNKVKDKLMNYGFQVLLFQWKIKELNQVSEGIEAFLNSQIVNWNLNEFKEAMGINYMGPIFLIHRREWNNTAYAKTEQHAIVLYDNPFVSPYPGGKDYSAKRVIVHELGHMWDSHSVGKLSGGLVERTGGKPGFCVNIFIAVPLVSGCIRQDYGSRYEPGDKGRLPSPSNIHFIDNQQEDFAESVAATILGSENPSYKGSLRDQYIREQFAAHKRNLSKTQRHANSYCTIDSY